MKLLLPVAIAEETVVANAVEAGPEHLQRLEEDTAEEPERTRAGTKTPDGRQPSRYCRRLRVLHPG